MKLEVVDSHNSLIEFYRKNGLEVSDDLMKDDGAVFSVRVIENEKTIAAATLSQRLSVCILDYVAVEPEFRKKGLGEKTVTAVKLKAKELGADKLYITAKSPEFFKKIGFVNGSPIGIDMNADCIGCPEFNNGCKKQPMFIDL
ncbi:MAG: GNAT family N-acetyltransferase [Clostridia bacterium]|nr:GNAT family N-acetyltransferase [Clostridia bacterium]